MLEFWIGFAMFLLGIISGAALFHSACEREVKAGRLVLGSKAYRVEEIK